MKPGDRVVVDGGRVWARWFGRSGRFPGQVVGFEDGNVVVRLDTALVVDGRPCQEFSVQETSLAQEVRP